MADYYTWTTPSTFREFFNSDLSFARSGGLAKIYGVPAWDGSSAPPSFNGTRTGFLTRAAFLSNPSGNTRPIMKGVFIRRSILCDVIPPPPPGAGVNPPVLSTELTTRQVVEGLTEVKGSTCASCHASMINGLGFATEGFDALGRARTSQRLLDEAGQLIRDLPIDTNSVPGIMPGDASVSSGPTELMTRILDSGKAEACLARQYFRFTFARWEDEKADGCTLEQLRKTTKAGKLTDLLRAVALVPQFRERRFD